MTGNRIIPACVQSRNFDLEVSQRVKRKQQKKKKHFEEEKKPAIGGDMARTHLWYDKQTEFMLNRLKEFNILKYTDGGKNKKWSVT